MLFAALGLSSFFIPQPPDCKLKTTSYSTLKSMQLFRGELALAQIRIMDWVETPAPATDEKTEQLFFVEEEYSRLRNDALAKLRKSGEYDSINTTALFAETDSLLSLYKTVMVGLRSVDDYNDPAKMLPAHDMVFAHDGECLQLYRKIDNTLNFMTLEEQHTFDEQIKNFRSEE